MIVMTEKPRMMNWMVTMRMKTAIPKIPKKMKVCYYLSSVYDAVICIALIIVDEGVEDEGEDEGGEGEDEVGEDEAGEEEADEDVGLDAIYKDNLEVISITHSM